MIKKNSQISFCNAIIIENNNNKDLKLSFLSVNLNICKNLFKIKELFKILTIKKIKKTSIIINKIEEPQINKIKNQFKNISIKYINKKKLY